VLPVKVVVSLFDVMSRALAPTPLVVTTTSVPVMTLLGYRALSRPTRRRRS
jgi:hypothetical protein